MARPVNSSWQGETARSYARLRYEEADPTPTERNAWVNAVARGVINEKPDTLKMMEGEDWSPVRAAFWLIEHHRTRIVTASSERHNEIQSLGDPACTLCSATGWVTHPHGGVAPCDCRTNR